MTRLRALIIDDDAELCALLQEYFSGHDIALAQAFDGEQGFELLSRAQDQAFGVVLLDVMLPGLDGFAWLQRIRAVSAIPVIMLTARGDADDRILGLELGADDYLAKPFNPKELLLRMRTVTRRLALHEAKPTGPTTVTLGALEIHVEAQSARYYGEIMQLTSFEFRILVALALRAGTAVSREELAQALGLGDGYDPSVDRSLDVHVSRLRHKLLRDGASELGSQSLHIKAIRGKGYLLTRPT